MPATSTDVRAWARSQGETVPERGTIPRHLKDKYDAAHPAQAVIIESTYDPAMGVTEADFPPDTDDYPADTDTSAPVTEDKPRATRERRPRAVKPPPAKGGVRERIFGGPKPGAAKTAKAKAPRIPLSDWAEETYEDLALLAKPIPPLSRILTLQAPYAGVVFDDQVKGTVVDRLLQPVAQYSGVFRALNGLVGPPVYVGMICATGGYIVDPATGQPVIGEDGRPVYDQRTQMLFQGLRYSLLQMTKIAQVNADQLAERTQASEERMAAVDVMIASIFGMPTIVPPAAQAPAQAAGGAQNGYPYPDPPTMDGTGADPGRL